MPKRKATLKAIWVIAMLLLCFSIPVKAFAETAVPIITETAVSATLDTIMPIFLYPIDVEEKVENNYGVIIRTYALKPEEKPSDIPKTDFEKFGMIYELSDVIKKENRTEDKLPHSETATINTANNDMNEILKQLEQVMTYEKDGYSGKLSLILDSVKCEVAGYKTSSYTMNTTREYPNFSSQDTSLVPKAVTEKGVTYALSNVTFKAQATNSIDYTEIAESYVAVASYSANASNKKATGYVTTADYQGEITKTLTNETIYKAYFVSKTPVIVEEPEPTTAPVIEPMAEPEPIKKPSSSNGVGTVLPIVLSLLSLLAVCGIGGYMFFINSSNTIIFSKQGVEYKKIGQLKVDYRADVYVN